MTNTSKPRPGIDRRTALKLAAGAGMATAGGLGFPYVAKGAELTLNL
jgi:hypothetical protein